MILYVNCHNCNKKIRFSSWASDRVELSKSKGNSLELTCKHCGVKDIYHINSIKATESKTIQIIQLVILFIGTPLLILWIWDYLFSFTYPYAIIGLAAIIVIPSMVYSVIIQEQKKKIQRFNHYKIFSPQHFNTSASLEK